MKSTSRTVTTCYEAADGTEPDITVRVSPSDRFHVEIETDLSDVPHDERIGVVERATELYWRAERTAYLRSNPDAD